VRLAAKLLGWKIDIKSEEEKRQEVEQQMQALSGGPTTPIEQVSELGDTIIQKLVAAGITTVESLADMTPEQLEEIPGIGEKTLEKISIAVRHYFGHFEEGEAGAPEAAAKPGGEAEVATATAVADTAEAELENAAEVLEESESVTAEQAEEALEASSENEALAEELAEEQGITAEELAIENVPDADEVEDEGGA
jgi:N utilization substance protein A